MAFTVRTLSRAELDAQQIYDWINDWSYEGARNWWAAFEEACNSLRQHALAHGLAPEAEESGREIRQILFRTPKGSFYRALYVTVGNEVRILRVRGPGQPDLLADELP